ncbi:MAG: tRNA preQ1(34) S-adenosylmethionine ribosyltransferase-isomerase QueA [Treponema sp.]|nr:tRNA preQ1(34) S-adenosylmethionine ribosyltransferase-isomerase QueA [Treponema sp.]
MKTSDFDFDLPPELIAQYPCTERGQSRLMTLDRITGKRTHTTTAELPEILCSPPFLSPSGEKPLLVFNDTKVRKARLLGVSLATGAPVEFMLVRSGEWGVGNGDQRIWKVMTQRAKRRRPGSHYVFYDDKGAEAARAEITGTEGEFRILKFDRPVDDTWLDRHGHIPLPPYIKRKDSSHDADRYQTIYAGETGSVAAPTAGLHFTRKLLDRIASCGIDSAFVTLHVGLGTFLPVRSVHVEEHFMHEEQYVITEENAALIEKAIAEKRKVVAVGTTSLRTLESAICENVIKRGWQNTSIFIYPGYKFKAVDALFTNFHTPLSTLLMLVSAFAGRELVLESYAEAVCERYRFFSYGDAMLIY